MGATQRVTAAVVIALAVFAPARAQAQAADPAAGVAAPADMSRLFFGPTGRMLAPGQGYIASDGPLLVTVQVGVTRQFSMGGGTLLFPTGAAHPYWVTPKVQLYQDARTSVAAGTVHTFVPGEGQGGFAYAVSTVGSLEASTTIGGGVFYGDESGDRSGPSVTPVLLIGGERRFKPRVSFITENYLGVSGGLASGGFRWRFDDWQLNLFGGVMFGADFAIPTLGVTFAYKFGKK